MAEKRYAIVRVDNRCPIDTEGFNSFTCEDLFRCGYLWQLGQDTSCKEFCRYGDTKEQLIRKVAQVLFQEKVKHFNRTFGKRFLSKYFIKNMKKEALKEATKIVEFLGVE